MVQIAHFLHNPACSSHLLLLLFLVRGISYSEADSLVAIYIAEELNVHM